MAVALAACLCVLTAYAKQEPTDHPLISRPQGAEIKEYAAKDFDSAIIVLGDIEDEEKPTGLSTVDGQTTQILYKLPDRISLRHAQVSYQKALGQAGFQPIFECRPIVNCGKDMEDVLNERVLPYDEHYTLGGDGSTQGEFLQVFRGPYQGNDTYVQLIGIRFTERLGYDLIYQQIVTIADAADIVSVASPEQLAAQIGAAGSATVSGIYFDHDQSAVKPESRPALEAVAAFLKNQPSTKVYVVGHTDSEGSFSHNQQLSEARAKAVSAYLSQELGVDAARLQAYGVGPLTPVASNDSEDGRGSNRRVSIVKQ